MYGRSTTWFSQTARPQNRQVPTAVRRQCQQSNDPALKKDYAAGDVYHALARLCELTNDPDPVHWKEHNSDVRQRMKSLQLAINYGPADLFPLLAMA